MASKINIEEIEQYLNGTLKGAALTDFERRMESDETLANRVEIMLQLDHTLDDQNAVEAQKVIFEVGDDFFDEKNKIENKEPARLRVLGSPWKVAASLAFVIFCSLLVWWQLNCTTASNQQLYANYFEVYEATTIKRNDESVSKPFDEAIQNYNSKNFSLAIQNLNEILGISPTDVQALYLLGHAHLNSNPSNYDLAIQNFETIVEDGKAIEVDQAKWYLTLIYLKKENTEKAKIILRELLNSEEVRLKNKAEELLKQID